MPLLQTDAVSVRFGGVSALSDVTLGADAGLVTGLIGPNGAGKTTLFKMIQGLETPDSGEIKVGETVKISYVDQSRANIDPKKTL